MNHINRRTRNWRCRIRKSSSWIFNSRDLLLLKVFLKVSICFWLLGLDLPSIFKIFDSELCKFPTKTFKLPFEIYLKGIVSIVPTLRISTFLLMIGSIDFIVITTCLVWVRYICTHIAFQDLMGSIYLIDHVLVF